MKPFRTLAQTRTPDGGQLILHEHDGEHYLKLNGRQIMSTTLVASELRLAGLACGPLARRPETRVLIGGLGLGFTLKRTLELVDPSAIVHVVELLPEVVAWNRELLGGLNGKLLDDPRVQVMVADVSAVIASASQKPYDAILLDVDNGPDAVFHQGNARLYKRPGFFQLTRALKPGGKAAFWSAEAEPTFAHRLAKAGFLVETVEAKAHDNAKRAAHRIYVATRPLTPTPRPASAPPEKGVPPKPKQPPPKPSRPPAGRKAPRPGSPS